MKESSGGEGGGEGISKCYNVSPPSTTTTKKTSLWLKDKEMVMLILETINNPEILQWVNVQTKCSTTISKGNQTGMLKRYLRALPCSL
jgi:hypothetical protein